MGLLKKKYLQFFTCLFFLLSFCHYKSIYAQVSLNIANSYPRQNGVVSISPTQRITLPFSGAVTGSVGISAITVYGSYSGLKSYTSSLSGNIVTLTVSPSFPGEEMTLNVSSTVGSTTINPPFLYNFKSSSSVSSGILSGYGITPLTMLINQKSGNVFVADFDQDGKLDIGLLPITSAASRPLKLSSMDVVASAPLQQIPVSGLLPVGVTTTPTYLIADFNSDAKPDLIYSTSSSTLAVCVNTSTLVGGTSFVGSVAVSVIAPSVCINDLASSDFDHDGDIDLIVAGDKSIYLFLNNSILGNSTITFNAPVNIYSSATTITIRKIAVGDLDLDGNSDVLIMEEQGNNQKAAFKSLPGSGNGTFLAPTVLPSTNVPRVNFEQSQLLLGDINADNKLDIVVSGPSFGNDVEFYVNQTSGFVSSGNVLIFTFTNVQTADNGGNAVAVNQDLKILDMNGDGNLDVVVGLYGAINPIVFFNNTPPNSNTFSCTKTSFLGYNSMYSGKFSSGDFDQDGDIDIVLGGDDKMLLALRYNLNVKTQTSLLCDNGSAVLSVSNIYSATYRWRDNNQKIIDGEISTQALVNNLKSGYYFVEVTENGYTVSASVNIQLNGPIAPYFQVTPTLQHCGIASHNLSQAILDASSLSTSYYTDCLTLSSTVSNVLAGTYYLKVISNTTGCAVVKKVQAIDFPYPSSQTLTANTSICGGTSTLVSVPLSVPLAHTYSFVASSTDNKLGGGKVAFDGQNSATVTWNVVNVNYNGLIYLIDSLNNSLGCKTVSSLSITVQATPQKPNLVLEKGILMDLYQQQSVTVNNPEAFNYEWYLNNQIVNSIDGQPMRGAQIPLLPASIGDLTLRVRASNPANICASSFSDLVTITVRAIPSAIITLSNNQKPAFCDGQKVTLLANNDPSLIYTWYLNGDKIVGLTSQKYETNQVGVYRVNIQRDYNSNTYSSTSMPFTLTLNVGITPTINLSYTDSGIKSVSLNSALLLDKNTQMELQSSLANSYQWYANNANIPIVSDRMLSLVPPLGTSSYTLKVTDINGCLAQNVISITVIQDEVQNDGGYDKLLKSKSLYTLGDDSFTPVKLEFEVKKRLLNALCELIIIDRLGNIVYQNSDYQNDWDFRDKNGAYLLQGTYYYYLRVKSGLSSFQPVKSFFDILR